MPTFEFRKLLRANTVVKVTYKRVGGVSGEGLAYSKNVSSTGINIIMPDKVEKGEKLELHIFTPQSEDPVLATAKIIWQAECPYVPQSRKKYYSTGMQFDYMSSDDAIKTSDFVRVILKQQSAERIRKIIEMLEKN